MQDARERLVRYLDDAWTVEKSLRTVFGDFRKEIQDSELATLFSQLETTAYSHEESLESYIRARGMEPSGSKSLLSQIFAKTFDILHAAHDEYEKAVTDLMKAYTIARFQTSIYEAIRSYSESLGDTEITRMAVLHRDDAEGQSKRIWTYLTTVSGRLPEPA